MATKKYVTRFGVRVPSGARSALWRVWRSDSERDHGDVYVAMRDTADMFKMSMHASGQCRLAYTRDAAALASLPDRVAHSWRIRRGAAEPARTVYSVLIPAEELRAMPARNDEQSATSWLVPDHEDSVVEVAVGLAPRGELPEIVTNRLPETQLLATWPSGESEICWILARTNAVLSDAMRASLARAKAAVRSQPQQMLRGELDLTSPTLRLALGFRTERGQNGVLELSAE